MPARKPAPERHPVISWASPSVADLIFYVEKDANLPENRRFKYGDPHPDKTRFPKHKLVFVSEQDPDKFSRWFYAADREAQDDYNWELVSNNTIYRTYIVPRSEYPDKFTPPEVTTPDTKFTDYVFAGESVQRIDKELDSLYVAVRRTFSIPTLVTYQWDETINRTIKITRQIVKAGTVIGSGGPGWIIEVQPGDKWYDLKITSEVQWGTPGNVPSFPITLDSIAADANFQFPLLLKQVQLFGAWAFASSDGAAPSYSEDFFFEIDTVEPHPGPFEATVMRFLTDNPDLIRAQYPTTKIVARAETFGLVKWWAMSSDSGNNTFALARQYNTPATVHDTLPLPAVVNYTQGGNMQGVSSGPGSKELPATPNFSQYISSTTTIAGVETKRSRLNLWEVQVTKIHAGGATVYNDNASRGTRPGTGSGTLPGQGSGLPTITIWRQPASHYGGHPNPLGQTQAAGGVIGLQVFATEPWTWEITTPGSEMTCADTPAKDANYPQGYMLAFTLTANNTGAERTFLVTITGQSGYSFTHLISQPSL